jgi:3-phenylpropionate/cinnamic acid dioxygenase small subunit
MSDINDPTWRQSLSDVVVAEGRYLDERDWDAWLDLYTDDAEYWVPCWADEDTLTSDPHNSLSLIYYGSRGGLEDRIYRIRTGQSLASTPLARTCHMNSNFKYEHAGDNEWKVHSSWSTQSFRLKQAHQFFGIQTHTVVRRDNQLKISRRYVVVMNDVIPSVLDVYHV